jgi:hypothetical protein
MGAENAMNITITVTITIIITITMKDPTQNAHFDCEEALSSSLSC